MKKIKLFEEFLNERTLQNTDIEEIVDDLNSQLRYASASANNKDSIVVYLDKNAADDRKTIDKIVKTYSNVISINRKESNDDTVVIDLNEGLKSTYDSNCAMLYFDFPVMQQIHKEISANDIYNSEKDGGFGLEDEPHCTLLYGLKPDVSLQQVKEKLKGFDFNECLAHNISLFENDEYDVLKFDIKGDNLHAANKTLCELPYSSDYPDYHPHMTVAYLKPGKGNKYLTILNAQEHSLKPLHIVYSMTDGSKHIINL
jgi:hypothetical protein